MCCILHLSWCLSVRSSTVNTPPQISIIIPCYNCGDFIHETIRSVIAQTVESYEIIIVDDGSGEATKRELDALKQQHPNIQVISQNNSGVSTARNRGIELAKGGYVTFLDADDLVSEHKLEVQLNAIEKYNVDAVFSVIERFQETPHGKEFFNPTHPPVFSEIDYLSNVAEVELFKYANFSTGLFKKEIFKTIQWNTNSRNAEDWELWLEFAAAGFKAKNIDVTTNYYRKHNNNTTKQFDAFINLQSHFGIINKFDVDKKVLKHFYENKFNYYGGLIPKDVSTLKRLSFFMQLFVKYPRSISYKSVKSVAKVVVKSILRRG